MGYVHRKKNPSSDSIEKRTNLQNDSVVSYENYQHRDSDRKLNPLERAELRELCTDQGIEPPDSPDFQDFLRIVGRGPSYWSESRKDYIVPAPGEII